MRIRPCIFLIHGLDCFSRCLNKFKTLIYALPHPWSRYVLYFTSSIVWTSMPWAYCDLLRHRLYLVLLYGQTCLDFAFPLGKLDVTSPRPENFFVLSFLAFSWVNLSSSMEIRNLQKHYVHSTNIVHRRGMS